MGTVGNGYISTGVLSDTVYMGGVFNGRHLGQGSPSHRAAIPSYTSFSVDFNSQNNPNKIQLIGLGLDLKKAVFYIRSNVTNQGRLLANIEHRIYAHRLIHGLIINELEITRPSSGSSGDITIPLLQTPIIRSPDIDFKLVDESGTFASHRFNIFTESETYVGSTLLPEYNDSSLIRVSVTASNIPPTITVPADLSTDKYTFIFSAASSLDGEHPIITSRYNFRTALDSTEILLSSHIETWEKIWESGVEISPIPYPSYQWKLASAINSSLYYLLSSARSDWPHGLSPGGLASNGYNGHTFWDQETWMLPVLSLLHSDIGRSLLQYRYNLRSGAYEKARTFPGQTHYQGFMFPWESAFTGQEACPGAGGTCTLEQHISSDVSLAFMQYFHLTNDVEWLETTGFEVIYNVAKFWISRLEYNPDTKQYDINNVIPPDEYHQGNNSIYTNVGAMLSIHFAFEAAKIIGVELNQTWLSIAKHIALPFDRKLNIYLEYDGYNGSLIKQADVVLLQYPWNWRNLTTSVRQSNLNYYTPRTDIKAGPAMTWSVTAINYLELNNAAMAQKYFDVSYANINGPFGIWEETPQGGTTNFITGAGGFLQAVVNGYGGIKIEALGTLRIESPQLMKGVERLRVRGVELEGSKLDVEVSAKTVTVELTFKGKGLLYVVFPDGARGLELFVGQRVNVEGGMFYISSNPYYQPNQQ
eukprot:TRINITY_DN2530_c0_g1_i3.p1 TRINITY_DN2530_c0_g1~~TRINITY_DN2530_c0_g1_i3.p1  ORF type:complete len:701 (-),score=125.68 TRINITY_DN2530_c0_g1_i3:74-2176(-)